MARFTVYVALLALAVAVVVTYQARSAPPPPLPTPTPAPTPPPTSTPAPMPTLDVRPIIRDYAARARVPLVSMVEAIEAMGRLLQLPALADSAWRAAVTAQMETVRQSHADMNAIIPPSVLDPHHRQMTDGMRRCAQGVDYLAIGLDRLSMADLEASQVLFSQCIDEVAQGKAGYDEYTAGIGIYAPLGE